MKTFEEFAVSARNQAAFERLFPSMLERQDAEENIQYLRTIAIAQRLSQLGVLQAMAEHDLDALVYPAVQEPPAKIGEMQGGAVTTGLAARARFPSIVVPAGFTDDGLPVGIEFLARAFEEPRLIELAFAFEQGTGHRKAPDLRRGFGDIATPTQ
jgi:Asp-tRNA(Asn)/Glu-tRNA(Gln) amidotransferase A subunit family amidase